MGNESVRFEGEVTWPEYRHIRRRLPPWWGRPTTIVPVGLLVVFWGASDFALLQSDPGSYLFNLGPFVLLFAIAIWAGHVMERWQWKSIGRQQGRASGEVGGAGLRWKTDMITAEVPWAKVIGHKIDDQLLLLYYSPLCAYYLPRSFFSDESAWHAAQEVVRQHSKALN